MKFIDAGATHVIVTSYVFCDGKLDYDRLHEIKQSVGKNRLVSGKQDDHLQFLPNLHPYLHGNRC